MPEDSFKVTKGVFDPAPRDTDWQRLQNFSLGSPKEYGTVTISEKINHRFFCADCGTSLFSKLDVMPGHVVIMAGGLDGGMSNLDGKIAIEYFCKDRVGYLQGLVGVKQEAVQG